MQREDKNTAQGLATALQLRTESPPTPHPVEAAVNLLLCSTTQPNFLTNTQVRSTGALGCLSLHPSSQWGQPLKASPNHLPALRRWPSPGYSASPSLRKQSIVPPWLTSRPAFCRLLQAPLPYFHLPAHPEKPSRKACRRIQDAQTLCCKSQSCASTCLHSWATLTLGHGSFSEI